MHSSHDNPAQAFPQARLRCLRPARPQFRPFSGSLSIVVERKHQSRSAGTQVLLPPVSPSVTHALDVSHIFAAAVQLQTAEREDAVAPAETRLEGSSGSASPARPENGQSLGLTRPRTSARRKRRFVRKPEHAKEHDFQQNGSRRDIKVKSNSKAGLSGAAAEAASAAERSQRNLTRQEENALCSAIQDSAVIEQHRQAVFSSDANAAHDRSPSGNVEASISGQDYEKLRQWKDAVGATTFADLQKRRDRGEKAKTMLLHFHKNLVRQFAWRCKRAGSDVSFGELILAGDEALIKAALKFDSKKGAKFSTYAFLRVQRAIVGYMMENEDVIKIPVHLKELQRAIRRAQPLLTQELGRAPDIAELARRVRRPVSTVALCIRKTQKPFAMDAAPSDSEKDSMVDLIQSAEDDSPAQLHSAMHRQFTEDVEHVLEMLPRREGDIVALRYGLFTGEPKSLRDVGALVKLSVEGVRKAELSAFRRLREVGRLQPLMSYLRETEAHGQGFPDFTHASASAT